MTRDDPVNWLARASDERRKHLQKTMNEVMGHDIPREAADYILTRIRGQMHENERVHAKLMRLLFEDAERTSRAAEEVKS